jgi:hypothetical protein
VYSIGTNNSIIELKKSYNIHSIESLRTLQIHVNQNIKQDNMILNVWHCPGVTMLSAGMHYGTTKKGPFLSGSATMCQRARVGSIA